MSSWNSRIALVLAWGLAAVTACSADETSGSSGSGGAADSGSGGSSGSSAGTAGVGGAAGTSGSGGSAGSVGGGGGAGDAGKDGPSGPCPGPVGWWRGDGNTKNEIVGAPDGVWVGASAYSPAKVGSGFVITSGAFVEIPRPASGSYPYDIAGPITIVAWIVPQAYGGHIVDKRKSGTSDGYLLDTNTVSLHFAVGSNFGSTPTFLPTPDGTPVHVAGVFSGDALKLFVNGALWHSLKVVLPPVGNLLPLRIGADSNGAKAFSGVIDEVAIFDQALPDAAIAAIHTSGVGICQ